MSSFQDHHYGRHFRELSLRQVKSIVDQIKRENITGPSGNLVQIEIFGHGALCMAVSGKCYLSLHTHNSSANRGACIQNCRRKYVVTDKDEDIEFEIDNEYMHLTNDAIQKEAYGYGKYE